MDIEIWHIYPSEENPKTIHVIIIINIVRYSFLSLKLYIVNVGTYGKHNNIIIPTVIFENWDI